MKISEVSIELVRPKDGLIGFASLIIEDDIYLGNIGIMKRLDQESYRLLFPTRKVNDKSFNLFYPISKEMGQKLEDAVTKKLKEVLKDNDRYSSSFNPSY